jgi:hypothetical protein
LRLKKKLKEKNLGITNIGNQFLVEDRRFNRILAIINAVVRGIGLIAVVIYAWYTVNLYKSANESNDLLKDQYDLLRNQYELSMEPQLYGQFVEEDYYLEYLKGTTGVAAGKRELYAQKYMESKGTTKYLRTVNPSPNMANQVAIFVYSADDQRLYGSSNAAGFIKPEGEYVFPIDRYYKNEEGLEEFLLQLYEPPECVHIIESQHLDATGENSYIVIIYKDLRGTIHLTKTEFYAEIIKGESFLNFRKTHRYKL